MHKRIFRLAALAAGMAIGLLGGAPGLVRDAYATLNTPGNTVTYTGNGATTAFVTTFSFLQSSDLVVTVAGAAKTLGTDFTVSGAGNATGTVTFTTAPANLAAVVITRTVDYLQKTSLKASRTFDPASIEKAIDKLAMGEQQLQALYTNPPATLLPANAVARLNNVRFADQFVGADPCLQIAAAVADLPATGGTVDARGFQGVQTACAGGLTLGSSTKPVRLLLNAATFTLGGALVVPCQSKVLGMGATDWGTKVAFTGLGATTDAVTVQWCQPTNVDVGTSVREVKFDCGNTGQDCVRLQGGRFWEFMGNQIVGAKRDALVVGGSAAGQWTEGGDVKALIFNAGRHCIRLDTTAGSVAFINHVNWYNTHTQGCGTIGTPGNSLRVELLADANNAVLFQNFFNFQTAQTTTGSLPDGIYINGNAPAYVKWWNFYTGEQESTVPATTTGYIINASTAGVVSEIAYHNVYQDPDYTAGQWGPNVGTHSYVGGLAQFSGLDVISGYAQRYLGSGGSFWSAANASGILTWTSNFGASSVSLLSHDSPATGVANFSSPHRKFCGAVWNGAASAQDCWDQQVILGAGANGTSTMTWTHAGSTGVSVHDMGAPVKPGTSTFASLGTPANGVMTYCSDCTIANPCAGAGTGAIAKRLNGVWVCN